MGDKMTISMAHNVGACNTPLQDHHCDQCARFVLFLFCAYVQKTGSAVLRFCGSGFWVLGSLVLGLCLPTPALAEPSYSLVVTLRDEHDAGVVGATIRVRSREGAVQLAQAITDTQGRVSFESIAAPVVRVAVEGRMPDGTRLYQEGYDSQGMLVFLGVSPDPVNLRVEPRGAVVPDPVGWGDAGLESAEAAVAVPITEATAEQSRRPASRAPSAWRWPLIGLLLIGAAGAGWAALGWGKP
jgi:hypothetical protein